MAYPPAPWTLKGYAVQTLQLVESKRARRLIPEELQVVSVLPGKTLGVLYLAAYGPGSVLQYHELIVAILTRYGRKVGLWVPFIYVDNPDSMAGGREIWGLPKELAQFTWKKGEQGSIVARQGGRQLCTLHYRRPHWLWRQPILLLALSQRSSDLLSFKGNITAHVGISRGSIEVPEESPFSALGLDGAARMYHFYDMHFVASAPRVVGQSSTEWRSATTPLRKL